MSTPDYTSHPLSWAEDVVADCHYEFLLHFVPHNEALLQFYVNELLTRDLYAQPWFENLLGAAVYVLRDVDLEAEAEYAQEITTHIENLWTSYLRVFWHITLSGDADAPIDMDATLFLCRFVMEE